MLSGSSNLVMSPTAGALVRNKDNGPANRPPPPSDTARTTLDDCWSAMAKASSDVVIPRTTSTSFMTWAGLK